MKFYNIAHLVATAPVMEGSMKGIVEVAKLRVT